MIPSIDYLLLVLIAYEIPRDILMLENYRGIQTMITLNGFCQIKKAFRALRKDDILEPYKSDHDFTSIKVNDVGEDNISVG